MRGNDFFWAKERKTDKGEGGNEREGMILFYSCGIILPIVRLLLIVRRLLEYTVQNK